MRRFLGPILLIALGLTLLVLYVILNAAPSGTPVASTPNPSAGEATAAQPALGEIAPSATPSQTAQPIFPTPTSKRNADGPAAAGPATFGPPTITITPDPRRCPLPDCLSRAGVSGRLEDIAAASSAGLLFGNYLNWWLDGDPPEMTGQPAGDPPRYWQMVPVNQDGPSVSPAQIEEVLAQRPGAIWIIGNEPDVVWQDNVTAEVYAGIYHDVHNFIKERDPAAQVAIAGVAQPSPLRLTYLKRVLDTYRDQYGDLMPIDIWTVHAFILREQAGSWGVGIPPGMEEERGMLYEIADHDDLAIFRQNLIDFRVWLFEEGYGDRPLAVTEFGILHPSDYGFPSEAVSAFMIGATEFMATASGDTGLAEDDDRLVQYWFWYSVHDHGDYPTGNLYNLQGDRLTVAGQAFSQYLTGR